MDKTEKALLGSIEKWRAIENGTGQDKGTDNCALCKIFYDRKKETCGGCPVAKFSGARGCEQTPYAAFALGKGYVFEWDNDAKTYVQDKMDGGITYKTTSNFARALARLERQYLEHVLARYRAAKKKRAAAKKRRAK